MKKSGLQNRFPEEVKHEWTFWHECNVCGKNKWSALHHIISPSSEFYIPGDHNKSVFNSCPIHNFGCHIGNEAWLGKNVSLLLHRTAEALDSMGYKPKNKTDITFLRVYAKVYNLWRKKISSERKVNRN